MPTLSEPVSRHYTPLGAARDLWKCKSPEVLLSGPAGTGKSVACLWKMHCCAASLPGFRGLIARKTRESLSESALVTFERDVLYDGHPAKAGASRRLRQVYTYPNGAQIIAGGLDKSEKVMSTDFDMVYVQEAIELTEDDWERLTTRLRNGKLKYQQLMGDTNPDRPSHWLKQRCDRGQCTLLESRHEDNPTLWDGHAWTPGGIEYLSKLDNLTGPRKDRLRYGRWVQAEGVVYDEWDARVHVIDKRPIPEAWPRYLAVDWGYNNPFVCQWWSKDDDDRFYCYREIYHSKRLVEDHARDILRLSEGEPVPVAVICDHDKEDRMTLERHLGWETYPANKDIESGIQAVKARLAVQGDGFPRVFFMRDALAERDPDMNPWCTVQEFDGYVWDVRNNRRKGERPLDKDDHGCFVAGTLIATGRGLIPIEQIKQGDLVRTHLGYARVLVSANTGIRDTVKVDFMDGKSITCTPDHPLADADGGWVFACASLGRGISVMEYDLWKSFLTSHKVEDPQKRYSGTDIGTSATLIGLALTTSVKPEDLLGKISACGFIRKCGKKLADLFQMAWSFIIRTETKETMTLITSNLKQPENTSFTIRKIFARQERWPSNGMEANKEKSGTASMPNKHLKTDHTTSTRVASAGNVSKAKTLQERFSAQINAGAMQGAHQELTTKHESVRDADNHSLQTVISRRNAVPSHVQRSTVGSVERSGKQKVYNLATSDGTYFANGVLVSNCDALRYIVYSYDAGQEDTEDDTEYTVLRG